MTSGVAVVVCTRDRPARLEATLHALSTAVRAVDEVVVVDSASRDPAVASVARAAGVGVVRCERPGLSRARNRGVAATTAPLVAFTDDDCLPTPGWTTALEAAFDEPGVGFVTGAVVPDRAARVAVSVTEGAEHRRVAWGDDPFLAGTGANMAFRRVALDAIGGFDELLGAGTWLRAGEDIDAFRRLLRVGWAGVYEPRAVVTHVQWRTTLQAVRMSYGYGLGAGALAVKGVRLGHRESSRLLWSRLASQLRGSWTSLRTGYQTGAAADLLGAVGLTVGAARAWTMPLARECFVEKDRPA